MVNFRLDKYKEKHLNMQKHLNIIYIKQVNSKSNGIYMYLII
jgi:hypothetical protein